MEKDSPLSKLANILCETRELFRESQKSESEDSQGMHPDEDIYGEKWVRWAAQSSRKERSRSMPRFRYLNWELAAEEEPPREPDP